MPAIDHLVVTAASTASGAGHIEARLGIRPEARGRHDAMGTHNRLMGLGDAYLEAIAIDPEGRTPPHARWFDLDRRSGPPRLSNWVLRLDDLEAAVAAVPQAGRILSFARDDLRWRMAVPVDGRLPYDGALPALIQWDGRAPTFPDTGSRLARLTVRHPDAGALRASIDALGGVRGVDIRDGDLALEATVDMPDGPRVLT